MHRSLHENVTQGQERLDLTRVSGQGRATAGSGPSRDCHREEGSRRREPTRAWPRRGEENQPERVHVRQPPKAQLQRIETLFLCEIQGSEPAPALGPILNPSEKRQLFEYHSVLGTKPLSCIKSLNSYSNPMRYTVIIPFYR